MDDRRDRVEEGQRGFAGSRTDRGGERRGSEGAGRDDDAVPVRGRQLGDLAAVDLDQRMRGQRRGHGLGKRIAIDGEAPPAGTWLASPARMTRESSRRISSCSSPTAFCSRSSERSEFEHTSSASLPVRWAAVDRAGRISCSTTGTPRPAICHAASLPARPPPMTWMGCIRPSILEIRFKSTAPRRQICHAVEENLSYQDGGLRSCVGGAPGARVSRPGSVNRRADGALDAGKGLWPI